MYSTDPSNTISIFSSFLELLNTGRIIGIVSQCAFLYFLTRIAELKCLKFRMRRCAGILSVLKLCIVLIMILSVYYQLNETSCEVKEIIESYEQESMMGEFRDRMLEEGFEEEHSPEDAVLFDNFDNDFPEYIEPGV